MTLAEVLLENSSRENSLRLALIAKPLGAGSWISFRSWRWPWTWTAPHDHTREEDEQDTWKLKPLRQASALLNYDVKMTSVVTKQRRMDSRRRTNAGPT
jgi:hypothetical protein